MKAEQSIDILEMLLDGIDPITGEVLPKDHVCQETDVVRALHAAISALKSVHVLEQYPHSQTSKKPNAGRAWTDQDNQKLISLYLENTPMDAICRFLHRRPRGVRKQLMYLGFEEDDDNPSGSAPSATSNSGKPWTHADHEWLLTAWEAGLSTAEMADHLGRTQHAIQLRLEQHGRYEGGMTAADEPPMWTEENNKELFRMVDQGCTTAEMAKRFGRTNQAIEARLFYLGLSKKPPKLF